MNYLLKHANGAKDKNERRRSRWIYNVVLLTSLLLFVVCSVLQFVNNRNNAHNACSLMVDQLKELITENEQTERQLTETLKEEYIIRANMAADHLDHDRDSYQKAEDFNGLVDLLEVDEIHVFDKNGKIINGSVEKYYGYTFDSGDQMAFFKPMLSDPQLSLCQDVTPNTAEGKPMMYAMVWMQNHEYLVQVGVAPERLFEWMDSSDIRNLVKRLPLIEGMLVYLVDDEKDVVITASDPNMIGYEVLPSDRLAETLVEGERYQDTATIRGDKWYITYERFGNIDILVSYQILAANKTLPMSMLEFAVILGTAFVILTLVTKLYTGNMEKQRLQLIKSNMAKTDFLRRMSHDIRTPLNGIIGLLEIDAAHPNDLELIGNNRGKMLIAADHLLSLINDVLQMSKLESGEIMFAHEPINLSQLAEEVLSIISLRAAEFGITVNLFPDSDKTIGSLVYGSPLHLRQVFLNIFTNCIKYNKVGGSITVLFQCLEKDEKTVTYRWTISDTGIGMSEEFLKHIFDPFTQARSDARSVYQGTGLGMTIVKGLLEQMKGSIKITSEEGVGSTFIVTIPFEIAESSAETEVKESGNASSDISGLHLLLAEDNELNAEIAKVILEDAGAVITIVENGQQAVDLFTAKPAGTFDVILMDVMMPVMDGLTATKTIRSLNRPDAKTIPIIAMTANAFAEDAEKCLAAGMSAHLAKPLDIEKVKKVICEQAKVNIAK